VLVSTSANPSTLPAAKTAAEVEAYFPELRLLDGETDHQAQPSRIIDAVSGQVIRA
jgi:L-threonylcarbamoyladenylate synthase